MSRIVVANVNTPTCCGRKSALTVVSVADVPGGFPLWLEKAWDEEPSWGFVSRLTVPAREKGKLDRRPDACISPAPNDGQGCSRHVLFSKI